MPGHFYHGKFLKSRSFSKTPIFDKKTKLERISTKVPNPFSGNR
jgi:hypothetical protein